MNKAFVRETDTDGRVCCPRCGALGVAVGQPVLDLHITPAARSRIGDSGWFCPYAQCEVAWFDQFERIVSVAELCRPVYPKHPDAPICACFGFTHDDIDADVIEGAPTRIRALLERSRSPDAQCETRAADGQCCLREVQRLYFRAIASRGSADPQPPVR